MTCTLLAALALGVPVDEPKFDKFTTSFHDPVIAPYSELILFHASIIGQSANHSVWLMDIGGKARRIAKEAKDPTCVGVLPGDPIAIIADRSAEGEKYLLTSLRTGEVTTTVPSFGLTVRQTLSDQLNKNLLMVASNADGQMGIYRFPINSWFKASEEEKENFVPAKVSSLTSVPRELTFSRDGSRFAMLNGNDLQVVTIGEQVTTRTYTSLGSVVHPRDFHPTRNLLMYESVTSIYGIPDVFGEVGVLDLQSGERRTAFYFDRDTAPDKNPKFDASGGFMMVDAHSIDMYTQPGGQVVNGYLRKASRPGPIPFPINLDRPAISLVLYSNVVAGKLPETMRAIMVTTRTDRAFLDVAQQSTVTQSAFGWNEHSTNGLHFDQSMHGNTPRGPVDAEIRWIRTAAYSPTAPGVYVRLDQCVIEGQLINTDNANWGLIGRYDAGKPPVHKKIGRDGYERGSKLDYQFREVQGDITTNTDLVVFGEDPAPYRESAWVLHYPNWSHYGS